MGKYRNVLLWRPRQAKGYKPVSQFLWSMHKGGQRIACTITGQGDDWQLHVEINGQWLFACRFTSWAAAVQGADDKYDALEQSGWTPLAGETAGALNL